MNRPARRDEDPAVVAWRIVMAPQPRFSTGGRHWWREYVTDAWSSAMHAWWLEREAAALGYKTEMAEWEAEHPRPNLKDFMLHLSGGADPYQLELEAMR